MRVRIFDDMLFGPACAPRAALSRKGTKTWLSLLRGGNATAFSSDFVFLLVAGRMRAMAARLSGCYDFKIVQVVEHCNHVVGSKGRDSTRQIHVQYAPNPPACVVHGKNWENLKKPSMFNVDCSSVALNIPQIAE